MVGSTCTIRIYMEIMGAIKNNQEVALLLKIYNLEFLI
jgi:hypothetical protein